MAGQKPGGYHFLSGKQQIWKDAIDQESINEFKNKFDSIEKNIDKLEREIRFADNLDQKVSVSSEFMKFFGLK